MAKIFFPVFFLLATANYTFSQTRFDSLKSLSSKITNGIKDERKKLDAILYWVTDNIEYDVVGLERHRRGENIYPDFGIHQTDSIAWDKEYDEAIACLTIHRKKAVCDGYARLFKSLCIHSGIQCEVINGKAKILLDENLNGHAWNAVKLNGKWQLVDPTWASGYVNGETFTKKQDMFYYLTSPEIMFINHLPNEQKWTLLDKSFDSRAFEQSPIEDVKVFKKGLVDFSPKKREIKIKKGQLFRLWLQFDKQASNFNIDINAIGWSETRASRLNIPLTDRVYDSLFKIDPSYLETIQKVEIVSEKITDNKVEFVIKPLTDIKGISIHVDFGFTALSYDFIYL